MVQHEPPGVHPPIGPPARLPQGFQKARPIAVVTENRFSAISTIHHVINRPRILDAQFQGHVGHDLAERPFCVNTQDPFLDLENRFGPLINQIMSGCK